MNFGAYFNYQRNLCQSLRSPIRARGQPEQVLSTDKLFVCIYTHTCVRIFGWLGVVLFNTIMVNCLYS